MTCHFSRLPDTLAIQAISFCADSEDIFRTLPLVSKKVYQLWVQASVQAAVSCREDLVAQAGKNKFKNWKPSTSLSLHLLIAQSKQVTEFLQSIATGLFCRQASFRLLSPGQRENLRSNLQGLALQRNVSAFAELNDDPRVADKERENLRAFGQWLSTQSAQFRGALERGAYQTKDPDTQAALIREVVNREGRTIAVQHIPIAENLRVIPQEFAQLNMTDEVLYNTLFYSIQQREILLLTAVMRDPQKLARIAFNNVLMLTYIAIDLAELEIVGLLLKDNRFDPNSIRSKILDACWFARNLPCNSRLDLIKVFRADPRFTADLRGRVLFDIANYFGNLPIQDRVRVAEFLQDDPLLTEKHRAEVLWWALHKFDSSKPDSMAILHTILSDGRATEWSKAKGIADFLCYLHDGNNYGVVFQQILDHPKITGSSFPKFLSSISFSLGSNVQRNELLEMMASHPKALQMPSLARRLLAFERCLSSAFALARIPLFLEIVLLGVFFPVTLLRLLALWACSYLR